MALQKTFPEDHILTNDEVIGIIKAACDGLSHMSYCEITGMRPERRAIEPAWGNLELLLESLSPRPSFVEEKVPVIKIVEIEAS